MPNHVTHKVTINGPQDEVDRFFNTCCKDGHFDFNSLIPKPKILEDTISGTVSSEGLEVLRQAPSGSLFFSNPVPCYQTPRWQGRGVNSYLEAIRWLAENNPETLLEGARCLVAIEQTGCADWYEWSCKNWGTKWPAYNQDIDEENNQIVFDTAWLTPAPIWLKLAEEFPKLTFNVIGLDEGWGFAVTGFIEGGMSHVHCVEATKEHYEALYGEPYQCDEECDSN